MSTPEDVAARLRGPVPSIPAMREAADMIDRQRATIERLERERDEARDDALRLHREKMDQIDARFVAEREVERLRIALCEIGWANRLTENERTNIARAALSAPATREEPNGN